MKSNKMRCSIPPALGISSIVTYLLAFGLFAEPSHTGLWCSPSSGRQPGQFLQKWKLSGCASAVGPSDRNSLLAGQRCNRTAALSVAVSPVRRNFTPRSHPAQCILLPPCLISPDRGGREHLPRSRDFPLRQGRNGANLLHSTSGNGSRGLVLS
ncbi:hypothetical protein VTK73DRAFT_4849 [Phialemonium thermophilum]|uniref:Secreted protein n=1 Tax=Phialemonium thermophilum TaxID=223376 RepID=A0ABR3WS31_9PEZI